MCIHVRRSDFIVTQVLRTKCARNLNPSIINIYIFIILNGAARTVIYYFYRVHTMPFGKRQHKSSICSCVSFGRGQTKLSLSWMACAPGMYIVMRDYVWRFPRRIVGTSREHGGVVNNRVRRSHARVTLRRDPPRRDTGGDRVYVRPVSNGTVPFFGSLSRFSDLCPVVRRWNLRAVEISRFPRGGRRDNENLFLSLLSYPTSIVFSWVIAAIVLTWVDCVRFLVQNFTRSQSRRPTY